MVHEGVSQVMLGWGGLVHEGVAWVMKESGGSCRAGVGCENFH